MATNNSFPHFSKCWSKTSQDIVLDLIKSFKEPIVILNTYMRRKGSVRGYDDETLETTYYKHSFTYVNYYIPRTKEIHEYIKEHDTNKILCNHLLRKEVNMETLEEHFLNCQYNCGIKEPILLKKYEGKVHTNAEWEAILDKEYADHPEWAEQEV